jgi:hypothetical protein
LRGPVMGSGALSALAVVATITVVAMSGGCGGSAGSEQPSEVTERERGIKTATIRVTGTPGTPFEGSYGSESVGTQSVEGEVPRDYEVRYQGLPSSFDSVTAKMQKRAEDYGKLTVQIIADGETKKERSTAAGFGVAKVSWNTGEG